MSLILKYNEGAEIVHKSTLWEHLVRDPRAANTLLPGQYARFQLLTEEGYHKIVFKNYNPNFSYGEDSEDFPLCLDFCDIVTGAVKAAAVEARLAVRVGMLDLIYSKPSPKPRHAIKAFVCAFTGKVLYFEPQGSKWLKEPVDCVTMDEFRA